jgi:hypothetical protein
VKKRPIMTRSMFTVGRPRVDKARTRPVYMNITGKLVGRIAEPWGRGAGYRFYPLTRTHGSGERFKTIRLACEGLGAIL